MPDKPYSVKHEGGEQLEPKQGHDHEGKPVDMGAPLKAKEMAEGLSKMLGGLPIEIVDKREERKMEEQDPSQGEEDKIKAGVYEAEPDDTEYIAERVGAREEAMGEFRKDSDLKDAFKRIAGKGNEINNILNALLWGAKLSKEKDYCGYCGEGEQSSNAQLRSLEASNKVLHEIATEIVTIASSRVTALTPIEERLGVEDADN